MYIQGFNGNIWQINKQGLRNVKQFPVNQLIQSDW